MPALRRSLLSIYFLEKLTYRLLSKTAILTELGPSFGLDGPSSIWICVVVLEKENSQL
jgi:hypothetical protein